MEDRGKKVQCKDCKESFYKEELIQVTKTKKICSKCKEIRDKGKKVQCKDCKESFYKEELIQVTKTKKICSKCKEIRDKGNKIQCSICKESFYKDELIQAGITKRVCQKCNDTEQAEINQRRELIDFICKGFGLAKPTGQQLKEIKEFKEQGYSYFEIHYTLYYIYCVLKKVPNEKKALGLVPFYYEKAKEHHKLVENAKRTAKNIEVEEVVIERKADVFKPNIRNTRLINIEEII